MTSWPGIEKLSNGKCKQKTANGFRMKSDKEVEVRKRIWSFKKVQKGHDSNHQN